MTYKLRACLQCGGLLRCDTKGHSEPEQLTCAECGWTVQAAHAANKMEHPPSRGQIAELLRRLTSLDLTLSTVGDNLGQIAQYAKYLDGRVSGAVVRNKVQNRRENFKGVEIPEKPDEGA